MVRKSIDDLKVTDYEGECIPLVLRDIRAAILWFDMVGETIDPKGFRTSVMTILQSCTVKRFTDFIYSIQNTAKLGELKRGTLDHNTLMELAEEHYEELVKEKEWIVTSNPGSTFAATKGTQFQFSKHKKNNANKDDIWKAPANGEPNVKEINGHEHKYCSKCWEGQGRWRRSDRGGHFTDTHGKQPKKDEASNGSKSKSEDDPSLSPTRKRRRRSSRLKTSRLTLYKRSLDLSCDMR